VAATCTACTHVLVLLVVAAAARGPPPAVSERPTVHGLARRPGRERQPPAMVSRRYLGVRWAIGGASARGAG
jgi:hypothetical protein